jgi:hypothetical protein
MFINFFYMIRGAVSPEQQRDCTSEIPTSFSVDSPGPMAQRTSLWPLTSPAQPHPLGKSQSILQLLTINDPTKRLRGLLRGFVGLSFDGSSASLALLRAAISSMVRLIIHFLQDYCLSNVFIVGLAIAETEDDFANKVNRLMVTKRGSRVFEALRVAWGRFPKPSWIARVFRDACGGEIAVDKLQRLPGEDLDQEVRDQHFGRTAKTTDSWMWPGRVKRVNCQRTR